MSDPVMGKDGLFSVADFGAAGDGTTDDTAAVQAAVDAAGEVRGGVRFPPGEYACSTVRMRSHTALVGTPTWSYHRTGGTRLLLADENAPCLVDLTGTTGARLVGMSLDGGKLGDGVHGIFLDGDGHREEETLVLDDTRVARFTGDAVRLMNVWGFTVRNCMFIFCGGNGLTVHHWDGFVYNNIINNCDGWGVDCLAPNGAVTLTGNRIEWNHSGNVRIDHGGNYNLVGNFLDRAGGPAVRIVGTPGAEAGQACISGNIIKRSGARAEPGTHDSCHIHLDRVDGVSVTGNVMLVGKNDSGGGRRSPDYGVVLRGGRSVVVTGNVMHNGAVEELMVDLGEHAGEVVVRDNPGCVAPPEA